MPEVVNIEERRARRKEIVDEQEDMILQGGGDGTLGEDAEKRFLELQTEFKGVDAQVRLLETVDRNAAVVAEGIRPEPGVPAEGELRSLGEQFVTSERYEALRSGGMHGKWTTGPIELRTLLTENSASGGDAIIPDLRPGLRPLRLRRLTVADLLQQGSTVSNLVTYYEEQTFTNAADTVAEGIAKPESAEVLNLVSEAVQKIATWIPVTDEMLEDLSQIRTFLNNRLSTGVLLAEEDQLLNGTGTPPDISGVLDRTGLQTTRTVGAENAADTVHHMITDIREAFYEPNGMVIHPADWDSDNFKLAKDANDQYFAGGPFTGQYGNGGVIESAPYWGLRVVVTPAIAQGTVLIGDFDQAQIFRRSGITVEASNSHSDFFVLNKTAIRAEERLALAVYVPAAFGVVDTIP